MGSTDPARDYIRILTLESRFEEKAKALTSFAKDGAWAAAWLRDEPNNANALIASAAALISSVESAQEDYCI